MLEKLTKMIDSETDPKRLSLLLLLRLEVEKALRDERDPREILTNFKEKLVVSKTYPQHVTRIPLIENEINLIDKVLE